MKHVLALVFFIVVSVDRFDSVKDPFVSAAHPGDGWGTIGWIADHHDTGVEKGWSALWGDRYFPYGIGAGLNQMGVPGSFFWRIWNWSTLHIFSADNVYDFTGLVSLVLIGWSGYLLAHTLGAPFVFAMLCGTLLWGVDNFDTRVGGHLSLTTYFGLIFSALAGYRFFKEPGVKSSVLLSVTVWFTFLLNEYYGYFALWLALFIYLAVVIPRMKNAAWMKKELPVFTFASLGLFALLMVATYPNMILGQLGLADGGAAQFAAQSAHHEAEFRIYSVKRPWALFHPRVDWLKPLIPAFILNEPVGAEFTFRIGIIPFYMMLLGTVILLVRRYIYKIKSPSLSILGFLWLVILCGVGLALKPTTALSLVPLTMKYAPMFRVGVRALMLTDIALLAGACWFLGLAYQWLRKAMKDWALVQRVLGGGLAAGLALGLVWAMTIDLSRGPEEYFARKIPPVHWPPSMFEVYHKLKPFADGVCLEIPFHTPQKHLPEADYKYFMGRVIHGKRVINGAFSFSGNAKATLARVNGALGLEAPWQGLVGNLARVGVKYLIVHKEEAPDWQQLEGKQGLVKVIETDKANVYQVEGAQSYDVEKLKKLIWPRRFRFPASHLATIQPKKYVAAQGEKSVLIHHLESLKQSILSFGPYLPLEAGSYNALVELGGAEVFASKEPYLRLEVVSHSSGLIAEKVIDGLSLAGTSASQLVSLALPFKLLQPGLMEVKLIGLQTGTYYQGDLTIQRMDQSGRLYAKQP